MVPVYNRYFMVSLGGILDGHDTWEFHFSARKIGFFTSNSDFARNHRSLPCLNVSATVQQHADRAKNRLRCLPFHDDLLTHGFGISLFFVSFDQMALVQSGKTVNTLKCKGNHNAHGII